MAVDDDARVYAVQGLRLRSTIPLAGFPQPPGGHDVDVVWTPSEPVGGHVPPGRLVAAAISGGAYRYVAVEDGGRWTLRVGGLCDFVLDAGREVLECRLDPAADPELVAVLVTGLAVAFILGLAGHCTLHASAVEVNGSAVALAGASGAGKSTLAALLCADGGRLVTDDVLRIGGNGQVACMGRSPQLRLRAGAAWALDEFRVRPPAGPTVDGRIAIMPGAAPDGPVPLAAVVFPQLSRHATGVELYSLTGAAAVTHLLSAGRVAGWTDPDVLGTQFRAVVRVATGVRVVRAVIPWAPAPTGPIVSALRALSDPRA